MRTLGSELTKVRAAQGQLQTENERLRHQLEETSLALRTLEEKEKERAKAAEDVVSVGLRYHYSCETYSTMVSSPRSTNRPAESLRL